MILQKVEFFLFLQLSTIQFFFCIYQLWTLAQRYCFYCCCHCCHCCCWFSCHRTFLYPSHPIKCGIDTLIVCSFVCPADNLCVVYEHIGTLLPLYVVSPRSALVIGTIGTGIGTSYYIFVM